MEGLALPPRLATAHNEEWRCPKCNQHYFLHGIKHAVRYATEVWEYRVGALIRPLSRLLPSVGADARMCPWSNRTTPYLDFTPWTVNQRRATCFGGRLTRRLHYLAAPRQEWCVRKRSTDWKSTPHASTSSSRVGTEQCEFCRSRLFPVVRNTPSHCSECSAKARLFQFSCEFVVHHLSWPHDSERGPYVEVGIVR